MKQKKLPALALALLVMTGSSAGGQELGRDLDEFTPKWGEQEEEVNNRIKPEILEKYLPTVKEVYDISKEFRDSSKAFVEKVERFQEVYEDIDEVYRLTDRFLVLSENLQDRARSITSTANSCYGAISLIRKYPKTKLRTLKDLKEVLSWYNSYMLWLQLKKRIETMMIKYS